MKKSKLKQLLKEKISKSLNESKLSSEQKDRLDSLRHELRSSLDPNDYDYNGRDAADIRSDIRLEFGDVIANQIENGEYEMHYPRDKGVPGYQAPDKLEDKIKWGHNKYRITKKGKIHKQDVESMKNMYKRGF